MNEDFASPAQASPYHQAIRPYACYALLILVAANFLNFVDRQILSILAQSIKSDLKLTDAQLGYLLGTAFGVLYGVVGIAVGRISDAVSRSKLMASGLALWTGMTAASGMAASFTSMAAARIGVGIGEATATPCAFSLLSDYFPAKNRSTVMGVYLVGAYMGMAGSLLLGGAILQTWSHLCHAFPIAGACGVAPWRAALLVVGLPGLAVALLVALLREPHRAAPVRRLSLLRLAATELSATVPPFTLSSIYSIAGWRGLRSNLLLLVGLSAGAVAVGGVTHDWAQWVSVALGIYSVSSWGQILSHRDRPLFKLTFGCPTFALSMAGAALLSCIYAPVGIWAAPYAMRKLGMAPGQTGLLLGLAAAGSAAVALTLGGMLTDRWKRHDRRAPIWMAMISLWAPIAPLLVMMSASSPLVFVGAFFVFSVLGMGWTSGFAALPQDLALPRMRGTAAAAWSLVVILTASGIGPYWAGKISTMTGSLTIGLLSLLALAPVAAAVLLLASRRLNSETDDSRRLRAQHYGEGAVSVA